MEIWFEKTVAMASLFYSMKLSEYEEACAAVLGREVERCYREVLSEERHRRQEERKRSVTMAPSDTNPQPTSSPPNHPIVADDSGNESSPVQNSNPDPNAGSPCSSPHILEPPLSNNTSGEEDTSPPQRGERKPSEEGPEGKERENEKDDETLVICDDDGCTSMSHEAYCHLQQKKVAVTTRILERMRLTSPIHVPKVSGFIDAIEEEKELAYRGLAMGYSVLPGDVETVHRNAERHGWATETHHPGSCRSASPCGSLADDEFAPLCREPSTVSVSVPEREALLYGEITSLGTRQLYQLFADTMEECLRLEQEEKTESVPLDVDATHLSETRLRRIHKEGLVQVAVDIGCGTGKLLYEWSRLASADSTYGPLSSTNTSCYCDNSNNPTSTNTVSLATSHRRSASNASSISPRGQPDRYSYMPYLAMVRSPCTSLPNSFTTGYNTVTNSLGGGNNPTTLPHGSHLHHSGITQVFQPSALDDGSPAFPTAPVVAHGASGVCELPMLRGWLGVGVEVVPSRMYVTRQALAPYYLDLIQNEQLLVAERPCRSVAKKKQHRNTKRSEKMETALSRRRLFRQYIRKLCRRCMAKKANIRYDPAPPRAVACPHQDPSKRRPTGCVLLYEGDCLTPGLLHNHTLRRFPKMERSGYTPTTPSAAKDNYFRIARTENGVVLSGLEQVHLSVFHCGVAAGESFVIPLCLKLERLLRRGEDEDYEDCDSVAEDEEDEEEEEMEEEGARRNSLSVHSSNPIRISPTATPEVVYPTDEDTAITHPTDSDDEEEEGEDNMLDVESTGSNQDNQAPPLVNKTFANGSFNSYRLTHSLTAQGHASSITTVNTVTNNNVTHSATGSWSHYPPTSATAPTGNVHRWGRNPYSGYYDSQHWRTVTCVLLLHPSFEQDGTLFQLPLFRCVERDYLQTTPTEAEKDGEASFDFTSAEYRKRSIPRWLKEDGLAESYIRRVTLDTSWMSHAPAYLLHFRFHEKAPPRAPKATPSSEAQ